MLSHASPSRFLFDEFVRESGERPTTWSDDLATDKVLGSIPMGLYFGSTTKL